MRLNLNRASDEVKDADGCVKFWFLWFHKWFSSRGKTCRIISEWSNQYDVTKSEWSGRCSSPEADRSKMLRMMQTYTWVQVYSFWGLINDSIAAYKQTCSCSGRPSVTFGASGFTWFATMCWCVKCIVWMGLLLAPCKFQHRDRSCLFRNTGKHQLSELFQA